MLNKTLIEWDDDKVSKLKELWKSGDSAATIAEKLGCARGRLAVIGKAKRLKLGPHPHAIGKSKAALNRHRSNVRKLAAKTEADGSLSRCQAVGPVRHKKPPRPDIVIEKIQERRASIDGPSMRPDYRFQRSKAWEALEGSQPVSLVDLKKGQCSWPVGVDSPYHFCALPVDTDGKYCQTHHHLSHPRT